MYKEQEFISIHEHGAHEPGNCRQCLVEKIRDLLHNSGDNKTRSSFLLYWRYMQAQKP